MAKTFSYLRVSGPDVPKQCERRCGNCDLMDMFITSHEKEVYVESGADAAFKNEQGEIIGTDADRLKMFCTLTGTTVYPDSVACRKHVWSKELWAIPNSEDVSC